jgi:hypothetical protein
MNASEAVPGFSLKKVILTTVFLFFSYLTFSQSVGLSFSYFIPRNGYFSTPISPFSLRGVGFSFNKYLAFQTGASLYRMSGLNMLGTPFQTKDPLVGPNFTLFVPAELVLQFKGRRAQLDLKGGGFAFYGIDQHLNYGNLDRAIRESVNWDVVNSDFKYKNKPGYGWHVGTEITYKVTRQFSLSIEANYLRGQSALPLNGSYTGGKIGGTISTEQATYSNAKVDFTGMEFSLGIIFAGR